VNKTALLNRQNLRAIEGDNHIKFRTGASDSGCRANGLTQRIAIWIADAHRDEKRFVVRADEKLSAFMELESEIRWRVGLISRGRSRREVPLDTRRLSLMVTPN
jgi:hypothetical protein